MAADGDAGVAVVAAVAVGIGDAGEVAVGVGVGDLLGSGGGDFGQEVLGVVGEAEAAAEGVLDVGEPVAARLVVVGERAAAAFDAAEAPAGGIEGFDGVVAVAVAPAGGGLLQQTDDVGVADPVGGAPGLGVEVQDLAVATQQEDEVGAGSGG